MIGVVEYWSDGTETQRSNTPILHFSHPPLSFLEQPAKANEELKR
jgi:hypothetical protein